MVATAWQVEGQYYENCNCDFVCPCVPGQMTVKLHEGFVHLRDGVPGRARPFRRHEA